MFEFFSFIINLVNAFTQVLANMIESVVTFITQMASGIAFMSATIAMLPPFCQGALTAIVAISLILVFIGAFIDVG